MDKLVASGLARGQYIHYFRLSVGQNITCRASTLNLKYACTELFFKLWKAIRCREYAISIAREAMGETNRTLHFKLAGRGSVQSKMSILDLHLGGDRIDAVQSTASAHC